MEGMNRRDPGQAADRAREAAEQIEQLAQAVPEQAPEPDPADGPVPADPRLDLKPEGAVAAAELARRQRAIIEAAQALVARPVAEQMAVSERSRELGAEFAALRDQVQPLNARRRGRRGRRPRCYSSRRPEFSSRGSIVQLAQGQVQAARDTRRRGAETLERAAQLADDMVAAIRGEIPPGSATEPDGALARAQDAQAQAAESLAEGGSERIGARPAEGADPSASQQAAAAMREAAEALAGGGAALAGGGRVALAGSGRIGGGGAPPTDSPEGDSPTPESAPGGTATADLAAIQRSSASRRGGAGARCRGTCGRRFFRWLRGGIGTTYGAVDSALLPADRRDAGARAVSGGPADPIRPEIESDLAAIFTCRGCVDSLARWP